MANPKQLTHRRSKLRWRLSYLTMALLALWSMGALAASVVAAGNEPINGVRWLLTSRISVVALIRQGWLGALSLTLMLMALTIWQIYRVGAHPQKDLQARRPPALAPAKSSARASSRSAARSRSAKAHT